MVVENLKHLRIELITFRESKFIAGLGRTDKVRKTLFLSGDSSQQAARHESTNDFFETNSIV